MTIYEIAMQYRASLLRSERDAARRLVSAYTDAWAHIRQQLQQLTDAIESSRQFGVEFSPSWLFQQARYRALLAEIEQEMVKLAEAAHISITRGQVQALRHAEFYVGSLFAEVSIVRQFAGLPRLAFESIVGFAGDGSPLRDVLADLGAETGKAMDTALKRAVLAGLPPREVARQVRQEAGGALSRLLVIARTETLRAYREGVRLSLHDAGFRQWRWVASLSLRTCPACLAMHGRVFPVAEPFGTHPNCRCTLVPVDEGIEVPDADAWLRSLSPEQLESVLGRERAQLYRAGSIQREDFVVEQEDARWGRTVRVKPLKQLSGR